jgi:hypothetical protein
MLRTLLPANAAFSAANKTITFSGTVPLSLSHIRRVINLDRAAVYYDAEGGMGAGYLGSYASPVLTLRCSTEGHASGDALFIEYDDGQGLSEVSVAPAPGSAPTQAVGLQVIVTNSFTRPSDTNAYAAQDVVSNSTSAPAVLTFANAARANGGSGIIMSARHLKSSATVNGASYRLHLYRVAPTAINDNAQFTLLYANRTNRVGFIDFSHSTGGTGSDSSHALSTMQNLPFVCDAALRSLFGILVVTGAPAQTSGEQHFIELAIAQN